jgi:hypothetical protein
MSSVVVPFPGVRTERQVEPLCAGYDGSWWFEPAMYPTAVDICQRCDMRAECLAQALQAGERLGVWGGLTPEQRAALPDATMISLRPRRHRRPPNQSGRPESHMRDARRPDRGT